MTTFLERILETKHAEVERLLASGRPDAAQLAELPPTRGFAKHLSDNERLSVIAEVKQASPSKGLITTDFRPVETACTYAEGGARAISVLTDETYFRGSLDDLKNIRRAVGVPVLRKDFIIHEAQIDEARAAGADAILLIVAALRRDRLISLSKYAQGLGLDVLVEIHGLDELDSALAASPSVLGVNNRDLRTFEVSLETTEKVAEAMPPGLPFIAESGVHTAADAARLAACGACGILVGESLMRCESPQARANLLSDLQVLRP
ncbi:indole-3-glycerol phosphate synthase TrpC [Alicyclobacillus cycloheptanicus]|uniref:Indole-3-glycerol phosphate synthase n=1 Tax=Alicyclobacillus cycloheptanicus TaxID=1457 RepID=A0ABT9XE17_9BACL|nr:indole-3-glycerol phosphate synthase TrpC [Alicyclobacillus cycloheptanicus]MDQ0188546.1 indole-3-glycerol phosphate synthase [Alicyclobacillus cycloheptanicus]WDM01231.1 indole-3-glycerol phosphate synthase TrpC [Alicyclobacillus cycloheptanicus]